MTVSTVTKTINGNCCVRKRASSLLLASLLAIQIPFGLSVLCLCSFGFYYFRNMGIKKLRSLLDKYKSSRYQSCLPVIAVVPQVLPLASQDGDKLDLKPLLLLHKAHLEITNGLKTMHKAAPLGLSFTSGLRQPSAARQGLARTEGLWPARRLAGVRQDKSLAW